MRRQKSSAVLLALWLSATIAEQAAVHRCPLHDLALGGAPAVQKTMAHHGAVHDGGGDDQEHGTNGSSHHCRCLEQCAGASAFALPGSVARAPNDVPAGRARIARPHSLLTPARTDTRLPFANGPPPALAA